MKKVGRKAASILLTLCVLLTMLPISALAADPGEEGTAENPPVTYLDENKEARTCTNYTVVTSSDTNWSAGWYVVTGTVNLTGRIQVSGDVHLILTDGAALNAADGGIGVTAVNSLTIYGQSAGTGTLTARAYQVGSAAAIGGNDKSGAHGNITINGGEINATGASGAAGIGGGRSATETSGTITINGGVVNATSGGNGAGIGGGYANTTNGGDITITGGNVTAVGGIRAAGIGTGYYGTGMKITITGGTVKATGGSNDTFGGAGIGAGYSTASGAALASITITGGDVTAKGGLGAAGIGSGSGPNAAVGAIEISGSAKVHAIGGNSGTYAGAGIGAGGKGPCDSITISGGAKVTATGGTGSSYGGAGIGAGGKGPCDSITISDSANVTAVGGAGDTRGGAGIGAGGGINIDGSYRPIPSCNRIEITGGTVDATGSGGADGIGGNASTSSTVGSVSISGGSFSVKPDGSYLAPYYEATQNTTGGYWTVDVAANVEAIWITDTTTKAGMLSDLLDEATSGTVQMLKDVTTTAPVDVNEGVTLDLAGKALTANALITFGGYVKDSTEGIGLLKVGLTRSVPNITLKENNPSLLIYDSEVEGYRLYSYTFKKLRTYTTDQTGNSMGFYFQLTFENLAAWNELNTVETAHGVIMSTVLQLPNNNEMKVLFDQSTIQGVASSIVAGGDQNNKGFWLTVTGLNKLESGQTLTVTPTLEAVSGKLVINTEAFQYSKTAGENN